jgi:Flagellin and related hook-associated proteins
MMAMNATRNLTNNYDRLATSVQRLSSGLRINGAGDDAAGLAIRELMRADIATYNQGVRNANDAISLIQTADGALGVIDEKLIRMKELAEQAATGTYNSDQRLMIESEYQAMASEVTRIANATDFNGVYLLNGALSGWEHDGSGLQSTGRIKIHFGSGNNCAEDYYYFRIGCATASALGLGNQGVATRAGYAVSTQSAAQHTLHAINLAIISKDKNPCRAWRHAKQAGKYYQRFANSGRKPAGSRITYFGRGCCNRNDRIYSKPGSYPSRYSNAFTS